MKLYFIRHAESEQNARHEFQSDSVGLSDTGKTQLDRIISAFKGVHVKKIYGSTMLRAKLTAEFLSGKLGIPLTYSDLLVEVKWPSELEGMALSHQKSETIRAKISEMYHLGNWRYSDEETYDELKERAARFIKEDIEKEEQGGLLLIVSHGDMIKMLIALLLFGDTLTPQMFQKWKRQMKLHHGGFSICERNSEGLWILSSWNERSHFPGA